MIRRTIFSFVVFGCLFFAGGVFARTGGSGLLISPVLLKHAKLKMDWQINLPVKDDEKPARMFIFDNYLYVLTSFNYLFCIDMEQGTERFAIQLAAAGLPVYNPQYYGGKLWFIVGNELLVLDPAAGAVTQSRRLERIGRSATCPAMRNDKHIFIAGADRRLHAIVADEYWEEFAVTADNDSMINSIIVDKDFVVFSTDAGNVVSTSSLSRLKRWQMDIAVGRITAPLARDGQWLYVGTEDAKLHKLNILNGTDSWETPFQAPAPLVDSAVTGKKVIYQYAPGKGLYAVNKTTGKAVWQLSRGVGLLAEAGSNAYVFAEPGVLVVMNNATGKKLYSVNFADVSHYAVNTADSTMYMADNTGRVVSVGLK